MSVILGLIASGDAVTRPALARETGLSPSTVEAHLETLRRHRLIAPGGPAARVGRGRPAGTFVIGGDVCVIAAISITAGHVELAVMTLGQCCLAYEKYDSAIADGPQVVLGALQERLRAMLSSLTETRLLVISIGLPGPVDSHRGIPVRPPIMPGWDEYPVAGEFTEEFGCLTVVDNDVNLMALGESRALPADELPLLYVKVGTGIGGGLVTADGKLHRGAHGAAGDIGHIRVLSDNHRVCSCGNVDCLEAVASVAAMARALGEEQEVPELGQEDLIAAVRTGDPSATRIVRLGASILGEAAASLVHLYNPARISLGGPLTAASDDLLAGVRAVVYQRALPLATRNLTLSHSVLGQEAAIVGASVAAIDAVLSARFIRERLRGA
ncbi:ROK family transcriptional regulator [Microbacterium sp. 69-10]|uniref:ROK family transcriptional regulator n=1 Tax=Microbacterium sp. 69-10 TaxID=1895783 RepID=UPI0025F4E9B2|nr:ROK family transcriptional regulator [Microbacterium sp. 69-10]